MIKDIKELNFPAYATLETATATISDMGDRTITSQVKIDGDVVPDFSYDWEVEFKGERYIHPVKTPQGTKDNTSRKSKIDLVFQHWAIYEMKRQYFVEMASTTAGTAIADKYIASLGLNLGDFVVAFNLVLNHYFDGRIVIRLNPEWQYDAEAKFVSISYSYIWDVLQQMHEIYGVRWTLKTNADGVCEILMGYPAEEVSHIFEYGFEGGLLSVQRQVQSAEIRNRLLGRGGSKNLPARYFKDKDPNNPLFEADPDWIPELANIAFAELRGKTFRDYVRGWKAKRYGGTPMAEPTEAYLAGYNAEKFDPIEYVDDKESIEKYGILVGALENNDEIYPSIQGAPGDVDMIVDAEQVSDDDVDAAVENDSVTTNLESGHQTYRNAPANSVVTIETLTKRYFSVPEGKVGNLSMSLTATGKYSYFGDYEETHPILKADTVKVTIHDKITGAEVKSSSVPVVDIPAGDYYYMISADVETNYDRTSMVTLNIESVYLYTSTPNKSEGWKQTFDIWVRNIWGSSRNAGETDQQYADRVWAPILGDRMGGEARVVFTTGWLSFSSDWEFPIVGYAFDSSKSGSEWRLTLAKSEAELEASGKYIPYEGYNASAGDKFFFIGVDMPYEYVVWAEERLDDYKRDALLQSANINPTWVIKTDKVRLNQDRLNESDEKVKLIDDLKIGSQIRLASKQFISVAYETLYVQSMTYSWQADTLLHPDIEIVVSDKVASVKNPVAQIQSNIESIQRQVGSLSNIQQIIRQVCDKLYLRKDGFSDISKSPTRFLGKISGENFRPGQIGGRDWGIYRDENGNAILEADKFVARQGILVNELIVSEATYVGGLQINSAASMNITVVEETEEGYVCFFDQKQGTVTNKFVVDDVVLCQRFDADQTVVKFYKARVTAVSEDSVTLSKTEVNGTGIPAVDDAIIQYGNYSDKTRQYVIVRDVIGGGYERMLMGLDSVENDGVEYYFAGKSADSTARWFVGGTEQFAEYKDGQLTIKGNIFVTGSDKNISEQLAQLDFIRETFGENAQGLVLGTAIIVGYTDENENFVPMAGLSGVYDKDVENGGPAAWYGGTPDDAKSVIFMDGTGYFADGLFKWDKDKGVNLGNGAIKINYDGSVEFGGDIKIGGTGEETLDSLLTAVATLFDIWKIDEETGNLVTERNVVIKKNLIVEQDTSSGGDGQDTPSAGLDEEQLQNYLDLHKYVTESRVQEMIDEVAAGDVDLTNYYTKQEVDAKIPSLDGYAKEGYVDDAITALNVGQYAKASDLDALQAEVDNIESVLGMDEEAEGIINTWNEVKAFLGSIEVDDDLASILEKMNANIATRALDSDLDTLAGRVGVNELAIADNAGNIKKNFDAITALGKRVTAEETVTNTYASWWADLKQYIKVEGGNIKIDTNLIVTGDTSSEGSGQDTPASGTVTGIKVNGKTYEPIAGIVTIPDYPTSLTWSAISGKPSFATVATSGKYSDLSGLPTIPTVPTKVSAFTNDSGYITGITKSMVDSALGSTTAGNANRFLKSNGSTSVWASISKTNVTDALGYTPLSTGGGTITGVLNIDAIAISDNPLSLRSNKKDSEGACRIYFADSTNAFQGYVMTGRGNLILAHRSWNQIGVGDSGIWCSTDNGTTKNTLLHSGNYSSYALPKSGNGMLFFDGAGRPVMLNNQGYAAYNTNGQIEEVMWLDTSNLLQLGGTTSQKVNIYGKLTINYQDAIHSGNIGSQNAGSATKLQTARTIWGQSFDGTGNITGSLQLNNNVAIYLKNTSGSFKDALKISSSDDFMIGYGVSAAGHNTYLEGNNVFLRYGQSHATGLILNTSGNVTIGASDLAGTNYKLYVDGAINTTGTIYLYGGYLSLRPATKVYGNIEMTSSRMRFQALHDGVAYLPISLNPNGGNVLIGTTTDNGYKLDVNGEVRATTFRFYDDYRSRITLNGSYIDIISAGNEMCIGTNSGDTTMYINYRNSTGAGTAKAYRWNAGSSSSWADFYMGNTTINGNLVVSGDTSSGSDIRFKDVIKNKTIKIADIAKAPLFTFKWNDREDDTIHLGSSAQYWEKVTPWLVKGEDFKTLDYATLGVAMGISLAKKAVNHEERIKVLEKENKALKEEIRRMQYGS